MKILQVSNFISHHQLPIAAAFLKNVGVNNFRFAATQQLSAERREIGWADEENTSWILKAGEKKTHRNEFERWWYEADVVLCGERLFNLMKERTDNHKLTFYMSERWWKPPIGRFRLLYPRFALMTQKFIRLTASPFFHYLPVGFYASSDIKLLASFSGGIWHWAYCTAMPETLPSCERKDHGFRVLWAGRMLDWKRVDTLIKAFVLLLKVCPEARLTLVGDGSERKRLERLAAKLLPTATYAFHKPVQATEVRDLMREHHVYVLPSNGGEGWGAVANEAMSEGCALIACDAAGASKSLIRHGETGLLFQTGDWKRLGACLCTVAGDETLRVSLAEKGQQLISTEWSPSTAAQRFCQVSHAILSGQAAPIYKTGPMAPIVEL